MSRRKVILILLLLVLAGSGIATYRLQPRTYKVSETMMQSVVFWNNKEAFLFLTVNTTGRSANAAQERLSTNRFGVWLTLLDPPSAFYKQETNACHLLSSGRLDRFALPERTSVSGSWSLRDGNLQFAARNTGYVTGNGFRWTGERFLALPPEHRPATTAPRLREDDLSDENADADDGVLSKTEKAIFRDAGWHYKLFTGYAGYENDATEATLPMNLGKSVFNVTVRSFPLPNRDRPVLDSLSLGMRSLELSGPQLPAAVLWNQGGWKAISKNEYQQLFQKYGRQTPRSIGALASLLVILGFLLWKFAAWSQLIFAVGTMKKRALNNMATSYSFPPATPAQFPLLDLPALDRYSREFEAMGFTRLADFSPVPDKGFHAPSFCRILAHTRHHCFAEVSQIFPKGKKPMPLKCSIQSCLQDGWTIGFSDRKPQAASSLLRRRKSIGICMPAIGPGELLQSFLKMRDQVSMDLGVSPLNDDTFEAYIRKVQHSLTEMREAVQQKSFAIGIPQVYFRKLALQNTKPEYVWLGDYPKEAEQRRQGYRMAAGAN